MKKTAFFMVVMTLIIGLFSNATVFADRNEDTSLLTPSPALLQTTTEFVDQSVIDYLEENDVTVDENSIIEVLPLTKNDTPLLMRSNNTVLSVSNIIDNKVHRDILVTYTEESDGSLSVTDIPFHQDAMQLNTNLVQPYAGNSIIWPPDSWDKRFTIKATAVYDIYSNANGSNVYYQPYGAYFSYTKGTAKKVSKINMNYVTEGSEYSYPGLKSLGTKVAHSVKVNKSNPAVSTMYSNTNYYPSNKVIVISGTVSTGGFITFDFTIDGRSDFYSAPIY